ncbi:MAG: tRNA (adenosine(37)-N6)-threonylcarbamoyltransferase complex dimerization subunit type 1 TsaB [Gammaproteobacteria bacterium]|nr:MAG: tRNA (adenosine(37)-N6)-threonylcarbamoyltransferase complex dimerization subunit type 1 TsaB [Gammaproteobacteria bacterium]
MNILALDTCTEYCSTALIFQGQVYKKSEITSRGHSDLILGMMDDVFKQAGASISDVDALAFGRGPGSFTGVRVGVGVTQGIAFAREIPVIPISSLAAVAQHAADELNVEYIAVAMDARMGEVYAAHFQCIEGIVRLLDDEQVCPPEKFKPVSKQSWVGVGTGWNVYNDILSQNFTDNLSSVHADYFPHSTSILKLATIEAEAGRLLPAEQAMPVYLRNNVAKKKAQQ